MRHPSEYEWYSMEIVRAKIGVEPIKIPTYLALTTFAKTALSHKQAVRLIELYGDLDAIYTHLGQITAVARKQLQVNEEPLRRRFAQLQMDRRVTVTGYNLRSLSLGFDAKRHRQVLEKNGFYSLLPLLARPTPVELLVKERDRQKFAHKAVVDKESMIARESDIGATRHCAIDTESDGKDPREATLLGVAFCCRTGVAYFVPLIERDLQSVTRGDVLDWLKRILQRDVGWVGHNIKYDDVLLRMHGLEMKTVCFDTMLAAKECHGDLESYSLQELSEHLLGKKIAAYRDLVDEGSTFLDLPFKDMVCHGCEDAEVTFRLHEALGRRLKERRLEDQFLGDSMGRLRRVCDWEFSGIRVNEGKANRVRDMMVAEATRKKDAIAREMGNGGDIDSPKDLAAMLNAFLGMRTCGEKGKVTLATLERIAIVKPVVRAIVEYKRLRSRIRAVEAILSAMTGRRSTLRSM